jgi:predicted acetyltransferase
MANQENFKNFISKLNDRNLQRKRESGITSYVLYSALIFCAYKLYKNALYYFKNLENLDFHNSIFLVCFVSNLMVALYFIVVFFQPEKNIFSNFTTIKYDKLNISFHGYVLMIIFFLIPALSTLYSFIYRTKELDFEYFFILGMLNIISILIVLSTMIPKNNIKVVKSNTDENRKSVEAVLFFASCAVIIYSVIMSFKIELFEKIIFIKIVLLSYVILFILDRIINQNRNDDYTFNLENFEYEIYLKDLNDDQIREKLQENYVGYFIDYWIDFNNKKYINFSYEIENKIENIRLELQNLRQDVDIEKYPIEFEGRKKKIIGNFYNELKTEVANFSNLLSEIKKISKDDSTFNDTERHQLIDLEKKITDFISKYKNFKFN